MARYGQFEINFLKNCPNSDLKPVIKWQKIKISKIPTPLFLNFTRGCHMPNFSPWGHVVSANYARLYKKMLKNGHFCDFWPKFGTKCPIFGRKIKIFKIPAPDFWNISRGYFMPIFSFQSHVVSPNNSFLYWKSMSIFSGDFPHCSENVALCNLTAKRWQVVQPILETRDTGLQNMCNWGKSKILPLDPPLYPKTPKPQNPKTPLL